MTGKERGREGDPKKDGEGKEVVGERKRGRNGEGGGSEKKEE